ncbi:hypothetical protein [Streptomyces sp. NPDC049040]|uniref:hypothetical protein n=1 Tax=Streptomyces sp. NPDC049040 TaxID=3365593 RepID=UPI00371DB34F
MADVVRSVTIVLAGAAALLLGHRALRHWWAERAGRAYELPVDRTGTALRAGAAGIAALLAAALAVPLIGTGGQAAVGTQAAAPVPAPVSPAVPPPPARTPEPAPPPPEVHTLGHPSGGTLDQLRDGTLVWLPPRYTTPKASGIGYPVVVAHLTAAANADLYAGFALALHRRHADPFVLVLPVGCDHDSAAITEAARRYRVLVARKDTGVIGVGADAPCAVREALATKGRYAAAVGISGLYPPLAPSPLPHPSLLLATTPGETATGAAALRLRRALHPHGDEVRVIDGVAAHRELFALVAGYLTEKLDGPAKTVTPPPAAVSPKPPRLPKTSRAPKTSKVPPASTPSASPTPPARLVARTPSADPHAAYPPHIAPQSRKPGQSP